MQICPQDFEDYSAQMIEYINRTLVKSVLLKFIIFLFLNQNICCGYSKERSQ